MKEGLLAPVGSVCVVSPHTTKTTPRATVVSRKQRGDNETASQRITETATYQIDTQSHQVIGLSLRNNATPREFTRWATAGSNGPPG